MLINSTNEKCYEYSPFCFKSKCFQHSNLSKNVKCKVICRGRHGKGGKKAQVATEDPSQVATSRDKAHEVKQEVDEVVDIMSQNIKKVVERGENLEDLEAKTDALQQSSKTFKTSANKVKRKMWWKNMKFTIILSIILIAIITLIVLFATKTIKT